MADDQKQAIVDKILGRVRELDGGTAYSGRQPLPIKVMEQTERLSLQLKVKTPAGTRYFMVRVQEKY